MNRGRPPKNRPDPLAGVAGRDFAREAAAMPDDQLRRVIDALHESRRKYPEGERLIRAQLIACESEMNKRTKKHASKRRAMHKSAQTNPIV